MNMIAAVAKAIEDNVAAALPDGIQIDWEYAAKAAIEAMREPTYYMIEALHKSLDENEIYPAAAGQEQGLAAAISDMIDTALEGK